MPRECQSNTRPCVAEDEAFVSGLVRETLFPLVREFATPDEGLLRERWGRNWGRHVLVRDGETPVGVYHVEAEGDVLHVRRLFLAAPYRGRGLGRRLMEGFEQIGPRRIRLEVWENNPAVRFYERLGYRTVAVKGHKYVMEKTL